MSDIKQYLLTVHDNELTIQIVELTVPSGMKVQMCEHDGDYSTLTLKLPIIYEGLIPSKAWSQPFPVFPGFGQHEKATHYQTYHRGFKDCWNMIFGWLKQKGF